MAKKEIKLLTPAQMDMYVRTRAVYVALARLFWEISRWAESAAEKYAQLDRRSASDDYRDGFISGYIRATEGAIEREVSVWGSRPNEISMYDAWQPVEQMAKDFWQKRIKEEVSTLMSGKKQEFKTSVPTKDLWSMAVKWLEWHNAVVKKHLSEEMPSRVVNLEVTGEFRKAILDVPEKTGPRLCNVHFGECDIEYEPHGVKKVR